LAGSAREKHGAMYENLTDEELMARFQKGEMRAFEALLFRHRRGIYHFIFRFTGNPATTEDLLQDVFLRLVHSAAGFERRSRFTTWLYTIARNLCIDHLRKKKHRNAASLDQPIQHGDESESTLMQRIGSNDPPTDRLAHEHRLRQTLIQAIGSLSEEQREVFLMREEAGLPFDQIAKIVKAPVNTVKSRMRYALHNLKANLEAQGIEPWGGSDG
jgi:RNA polymerase sigma-70 factor, ECF subfamily